MHPKLAGVPIIASWGMPMDVDAATEGIAVVRLQSVEPKDARHDRITADMQHKDLTCRFAGVKDGPQRRSPDLPADAEMTEWRGITPSRSPAPNLDVETGYSAEGFPSVSTSISDRGSDDQAMMRVGATGQHKDDSAEERTMARGAFTGAIPRPRSRSRSGSCRPPRA